MLKRPRLFDDAFIDFLQRSGFQFRIGLVQDITQHLFFSRGLQHIFPDLPLERTDILGAIEPFAEQAGKFIVDGVNFFSPLFKFDPVIILVRHSACDSYV